MWNLVKLSIISSLLIVGLQFEAYAVKSCPNCLEDVTDEQLQEVQALECSHGHRIHQGCLPLQIESCEDLQALQRQGLSCCGGEGCRDKFPLSRVMALLGSAEKAALRERIEKAASLADSPRLMTAVDQLKLGITESFNLCCPAEGCGAPYALIEGCNAAKCDRADCCALFCYLCLEVQESRDATHAHVRGHSNNFWELRPGYTDRYHGLVARHKLRAVLGTHKIEEATRNQALDESKTLLKEKKMWPMPAGLAAETWIEQVRAEGELSNEARVVLLQNEAIYRRQIRDSKNRAIVEAEILRLGGLVLASLDAVDAGGVGVEAPQSVAAPSPVDVGHLGGVAQVAAQTVLPVLADHPRIHELSARFRALGDMYEVSGLIWSGVAPEDMGHADAVTFCGALGNGARLPTKGEYLALSRAMGARDPEHNHFEGYHFTRLPNMRNRWFWSTSVSQREDGFAFYFSGTGGYVQDYVCSGLGSVRCVR